MRLTKALLTCVTPSLLRKAPFPILKPGLPLPATEKVDEEVIPGYESKVFYPARPGEVLADRWQLLVKVGWGSSSTVWFAQPEEPEDISALKIKNSNALAKEERDLEEHIATADLSHLGRSLFRTSTSSFEIQGPHEKHLCLTYPPLREPLWLFRRRFVDESIPLPIVKGFIKILLLGLDYLHSKCRVAHLDIKLENILVTFEDEGVLSDFMNAHFEEPMSYKYDEAGRPVYRRHNDFGPLRELASIPLFIDFELAERFETDGEFGILPIHPDHYRAPEIILGCGYKMSVDMWNLGVVLWDLIEGTELFTQIHDEHGNYNAKEHLAEMIALLGPPPPEVIERHHEMLGFKFPQRVRTATSPLCESVQDFFGGPFFDKNGQFLHADLIPNRKLSDTLPSLNKTEKEEFISFVKLMLAWDPAERKTAGELAEHPYLG